MKTICITLGGSPTIPRYFLRSGLLRRLTAREDILVILLVLDSEKGAYEKEFGGERIEVVEMPAVQASRWFEFLISFSRSAFHAKLSKGYHWLLEYDTQKISILRVSLNRFIAYFLGTWPLVARLVQYIVRFLVLKISPPDYIEKFFEKYQPSLVFSTNVTNTSFDVPVLCEARRRGIKTAAGIRGWDALSNIGFMLIHPDRLILQTQYVKEVAILYHFFPSERIMVTGFPHYDWYMKHDLILSREKFFESLGINPQKKLILFGAVGGVKLQEREIEFAEMFNELAKNKQIPNDVVMLYRHHPYYTNSLERLDSLEFVIQDKIRAKEIPKPGEPEADLKDMIHQMNSLYHCEMLITHAGTIVLDAVAFNKPIVTVILDGKKKYSYWNSLIHTHNGVVFDWWEVGRCGGMRKVYSEKEYAEAINDYLKNPNLDSAGRDCIRRRFVEPFDGHASARLADSILSMF